MSLRLLFHPLSSFCQKVLIALYENDTPFTPELIDLGNPDSRTALARWWPLARFPVLRDEARDRTIPEATIIIEYLAQHYPGKAALIPADPELARQTRFRDRVFDLYVNVPMQKVITDRLRPAGQNDAFGVEQSRNLLRTAYDMIDADLATQTWAMGETFSMADCAAAPALYYANMVLPLADAHRHAAAYFDRLMRRPSFARVVQEAAPYLHLMPKG